jgi:hypothetical protein
VSEQLVGEFVTVHRLHDIKLKSVRSIACMQKAATLFLRQGHLLR